MRMGRLCCEKPAAQEQEIACSAIDNSVALTVKSHGTDAQYQTSVIHPSLNPSSNAHAHY
jgi:hypothetical protein